MFIKKKSETIEEEILNVTISSISEDVPDSRYHILIKAEDESGCNYIIKTERNNNLLNKEDIIKISHKTVRRKSNNEIIRTKNKIISY